MLQSNPSAIPERLAAKANSYEAMRYNSDKLWPSYGDMLAMLCDRTQTLKSIGIRCGVKKQRVAQVLYEFFPGVRTDIDGRRSTRARQRRRRRERMLRRFLGHRAIRQILAEAARTGLHVRPIRLKHTVSTRRVRIGRLCSRVFFVTNMTKTSSNGRFYARTHDLALERLARDDIMTIVLDIRSDDVIESGVFSITTKEFIESGLKYVLIPIGLRGNGGKPPIIDWHARRGFAHLFSH